MIKLALQYKRNFWKLFLRYIAKNYKTLLEMTKYCNNLLKTLKLLKLNY